MRSGAAPRERAEEKHGHGYVAVIGADKFVRAALEWQVILTYAIHAGTLRLVMVGSPALVRPLQGCDVDLFHLQHRLEDSLLDDFFGLIIEPENGVILGI